MIIFGAGDFSASRGAWVETNVDPVVDPLGDMSHHARSRVVAARAASIDALLELPPTGACRNVCCCADAAPACLSHKSPDGLPSG
jgi:hypothetical protein